MVIITSHVQRNHSHPQSFKFYFSYGLTQYLQNSCQSPSTSYHFHQPNSMWDHFCSILIFLSHSFHSYSLFFSQRSEQCYKGISHIMLLQAQYPPKTSYHSKSMPCYAIWPLVISLPSSTFSFPSITHLAPVIMVFLFFLDHVELVPVSEQTGICCSFCLMGSFPEIFIACTLKSQKYHFFLDSFPGYHNCT